MAMLTVNNDKAKDYRMDESFKALRTNIEFCGEDVKVISLTSCTPSEGKSSTSLNLSISLAEAGKKVLLIDADLRKSVLLNRIKTERGSAPIKGLSHFLAGQVVVQDIINQTTIPNLNIIVAGPTTPNPAELLGGKHFDALLEAAKKVYDYIIIDTPPLGSVIDSAIVSNKCDGVAIVVEASNVSYKFVASIVDQLKKSNCHILGVILNKVVMDKNGYYGHYYGKYGQYGNYGHSDSSGKSSGK